MDGGEEMVPPEVIVRCSWCGKVFKVHADRLPAGVASFPCRGCGSILSVRPEPDEGIPGEEGPAVLVAVGEEDLAGLIRKILQQRGYRVIVSSTGEETLRLVETEGVDLLLLSLFFQDLTGFEILDRIKQGQGRKRVRTILLSSVYQGAGYKRAPTTLFGADDYVERHHLPDLLVPKIQRLLETDAAAPLPKSDSCISPLTDEEVLQKRELEKLERSPVMAGEEGDGGLKRLCRVIAGDIVLYNGELVRTTEPSLLMEKLSDDFADGEALLERRFGQAGKDAAGSLREEVMLLLRVKGVRNQ